jgi:hemoglobin
MVLGGPNKYKGRDMSNAHQHLKLENAHFDAIVQNLVATLTDLEVDNDTINEIGSMIEPLRKEIVY